MPILNVVYCLKFSRRNVLRFRSAVLMSQARRRMLLHSFVVPPTSESMSSHCPCSGATSSKWHLDTLRKLCAPHLASTRPQLSFLYPPFRNRRHAGHTANGGGNSEPSASEEERLSRIRRVQSGKIDVSSPDAVKDMKDLMSSLKAFAEFSSHAALPEAPNMEHGPIRTNRPAPPESPIFHHLENTKNKRNQKERKLPAPGPNPLAYDPWASMLADPVRMCHATGLRLPKALMTKWGLVRHPEKETDVYLLPTELADVEQLESMGGRAQQQRQDAMKTESRPPSECDGVSSEDSLVSAQEADVSEGAQLSPDDAAHGENIMLDQAMQPKNDTSNSSPPDALSQPIAIPAAIRVLPHLNLLRQLTLQITGISPRSGKLFTKPNFVSRLLPTPLKLRLAEFKHYLKQRRQVERQTGITSRKPVPQGTELDVSLLQWQASVAGRVLGLMRRRVVVATKRILELEADRLQRRRVQVLSEGYMRGEESAVSPTLSTDIDSASGHDDPGTATGQIVENEAVGEQAATVHSDRLTDEAKSQANQVQRSKHLQEIQTRIFLYFGPYPSSTLNSITTTNDTTPLDPAAANAYLPPMLRSHYTAQAFPSFPLLPLLGPALHAELHAAVLQHVRAQHILTRGTLDPDASSAQPFSLMVKVTAWHANSLVREVWRLWRYVGGHEALDLWAAGIDMGSDAVVGDPRAAEMQQIAAVAAAAAAAAKGGKKTTAARDDGADVLWDPVESGTRKISRWERRKGAEAAARGEVVDEGTETEADAGADTDAKG